MRSTFLRGAALIAILTALRPWTVRAEQRPIDLTLAAQYFDEAKALARKDNGRLWDVSLDGPLLFVDAASRMVVANQADRKSRLAKKGNVFVGQLPVGLNVANTAIDWAGVHWTMVAWPLPADKNTREILLLHESWHRIQDQVGFPGASPKNDHLDTPEGRYWLQLEWRALVAALGREGDERRRAIEDALVFRARRRQLFRRAAKQERLLEMHEGVAEYTGVKLCGLPDAGKREYARKSLSQRPKEMSTFVRSFAYLSGPAYGLLLDEAGVPWRKNSQADFGDRLRTAFHIELPGNLSEAADARARAYEGETLHASESKRETARQKRIADYRARLVDGPVLMVPLDMIQISFDPTNLQPFPGHGTVYPNCRISCEWGVLNASRGALVSESFLKAYVAAPSDPQARPLKGPGWQLDLKEGWKLEPGPRPGDYALSRVRK
jgi:hypothetical protein